MGLSAGLREEVRASDLPGLIDRCLADLMTYERFQKQEECLAKRRQLPFWAGGNFWRHQKTFKEKLVDMVNTELGEYSPFLENRPQAPIHYDDYDFYYDFYDPYRDVDPEWTLWWRIDVEHVKCQNLKDKASRLRQQEKKQQRSCGRVQQRLRGGRFKPGSRISDEERLQ